jgi:pimeloyl-ACP methyl ester carboxylesterase
MQTLSYLADRSNRAESLLVLIAGAGDDHTAFDSRGWISEARRAGLPHDIIVADAHVDYFTDYSIATRLHAAVLAPAKAAGYSRIVMGGISLGSLAALIYAKDNLDYVDELVLFAPYIGNRGTLLEIEQAGGLDLWANTVGELPTHDERKVWKFIQRLEHTPLAMQLYYGDRDRFVRFHDLLASRLPAHRVCKIAGDHDWPTYNELWKLYLQNNAGE